jgi:hypothetical protein
LLSATERTLRARIGAHSLHAKHDSSVVSAPGRKAAAEKLSKRLLAEFDPNNSLSEEEHARRLEHARRAHFARLALRRSKKRQGGA